MWADDDLPKEVFQDYYRSIVREDELPVAASKRVVSVERRNGTDSFVTETEDRDQFTSRVIVDSTGIVWSKVWPEWVRNLHTECAFHSIGHGRISDVDGKRIFVVGGGHATPDIATRMSELGAKVTVAIRGSKLKTSFLPYDQKYLSSQFERRYTSYGHHTKYRLLRALQTSGPWVTGRSHRDLLFRIQSDEQLDGTPQIELFTHSKVELARHISGGIEICLSSGPTRVVDYVICATGFRANMPDSTAFEWRGFKFSTHVVGGYPRIDNNYEWTACPGVFFMGYLSQLGPRGPIDSILFGTQRAIPAVTEGIVSRLKHVRRQRTLEAV